MRHLAICITAISLIVPAAPAFAVSPQNPYRSFNLSGINYGSMQWERAQRQGKRVRPSSNTPSRSSSRNSGATVGGAVIGGGAGGVITSSGRSSQPGRRRR